MEEAVKSPPKKIFLKWLYDAESIDFRDNSADSLKTKNNLEYNNIKSIFLVTKKSSYSKYYLKALKRLSIKNELNIKELVFKKLKKKSIPSLLEFIKDIYDSIKNNNCEISSFEDSYLGILLACLFIYSGLDYERAIEKVKELNPDLIKSNNEINFIKLFSNSITEKKNEPDQFIDSFEFDTYERINFNKMDSEQYQQEGTKKIKFSERYTIRTRIIFIISLIIVFSLSIMIVWATILFKMDSEIRVKENNHNLAQMIGGRVNSEIYGAINKAEIISAIILKNANNKSKNNNQDVIDLLYKEKSNIIFLGIAEKANGQLKFIKSIKNKKFLKSNKITEKDLNRINKINDRHFLETFNHKKVFRNVSPESGLPLLAISFPYEVAPSGIKSILLLHLSLNKFVKIFQTSGIIKTLMVNDRGELIAHPDSKLIQKRLNMKENPIVKEMLASKLNNGQLQYSDKDGKKFIGSFRKFKATGLGIIVTAKEEEVFKEVYRIQRRNINIMLIVLIVSILIAFFFSRTLSIPIVNLVRETQQFQFRNFQMKSLKRKDEITYLDRSFNSMMVSIIDAQKKLKDYAENLEEMVSDRTAELKKAKDALWGEMHIATKIQTVLLPKEPKMDGYDITGYMMPASEVGGDYYDIINAEGRDWVVIGDVSGHGVSAGLIMMMIQTSIRLVLDLNPNMPPSELLAAVNRVIARNIKQMGERKYMTITICACGENGVFTFSGLHIDLLVYRAESKTVENIQTRGMWIGLRPEIKKYLKNDTFELKKNDVLIMYTDGITESTDQKDEIYTVNKLAKVLAQIGHYKTPDIKDKILQSLDNYNKDDDVTFVIVKRLGEIKNDKTTEKSQGSIKTENRIAATKSSEPIKKKQVEQKEKVINTKTSHDNQIQKKKSIDSTKNQKGTITKTKSGLANRIQKREDLQKKRVVEPTKTINETSNNTRTDKDNKIQKRNNIEEDKSIDAIKTSKSKIIKTKTSKDSVKSKEEESSKIKEEDDKIYSPDDDEDIEVIY